MDLLIMYLLMAEPPNHTLSARLQRLQEPGAENRKQTATDPTSFLMALQLVKQQNQHKKTQRRRKSSVIRIVKLVTYAFSGFM